MRTINLLGLEYTEEMIDMLVKFDKHMNNKFAEKMVKGDLLTMDDIETEREAYIEKLDEHEGLVVKHFVSASFLNKQNPIMGMLPSIPAIMFTCLIDIFAIRLIVSALIAGVLTIELKMFADKRAYKKIMNIIKYKAREDN